MQVQETLSLAAACIASSPFLYFFASQPVAVQPPAETWKVIGWNDLGMHCMDADYSVFSILPPYNTIQA